MAKLTRLLLGLVFLALALQKGQCLTPDEVLQYLQRIRDRSTSTGNTQFAGVTLLDSRKKILYEDIQTITDTTPTHTEEHLLKNSKFRSYLNNAGYLFIYTKNSPCVSSKASQRQGRTSCTVQITDFARQNGHLKVHVGFQLWYGKGNRFESSAGKEAEFTDEACQNHPSNLEYIFMPNRGPTRVISCNGRGSGSSGDRGTSRGRSSSSGRDRDTGRGRGTSWWR